MRVTARFDFDIPALAKSIKQDADTIQRKIALEIFARLIATTPRDTSRAVSGWSIDTRHGSYVPPKGLSSYQPQTPSVPSGPMTVIYNNVGYIMLLNEGHSKQAPAMFVETAVDSVMGGF